MDENTIIQTIDDLFDNRSKILASKYNLKMSEVLPNYIELEKELFESGGSVEIDMESRLATKDSCNAYIRKIACGMIVGYELTKRPVIRFDVTNQQFGSGTDKVLGKVERTHPKALYELIGIYCGSVIDGLELMMHFK